MNRSLPSLIGVLVGALTWAALPHPIPAPPTYPAPVVIRYRVPRRSRAILPPVSPEYDRVLWGPYHSMRLDDDVRGRRFARQARALRLSPVELRGLVAELRRWGR